LSLDIFSLRVELPSQPPKLINKYVWVLVIHWEKKSINSCIKASCRNFIDEIL